MKRNAPIPDDAIPVSVLFGYLYLLVLGGSSLWGLYYSWGWPALHDGVIMHFIAGRMLQGEVPYRDIYEMNFPGIYLLHMLVLEIGGRSDLAFRLFDLLFCFSGAGLIAHLSWRGSRLYALAGAALYITFHLSWGAESMAQRDFLIVPLLLGSACLLRNFLENPAKIRTIFAFGLLMGCTFWMKPITILFVALAGVALLLQVRPWKRTFTASLAMSAGVVLPAIAAHLWLWKIGALADFYDILLHFTLPVYAGLDRFSSGYGTGFLIGSALGIAFMLFLMKHYSDVPRSTQTILLVGLIYGCLNFYLQGKGFWYHIYPLGAFVILYFTIILPRLAYAWPMIILYNLLLMLCLKLSPLQALSTENLDKYRVKFNIDALAPAADNAKAALATVPAALREAFLAQHPRQAVEVLTQQSFLWNVAYRQQWIPSTRPIYPFPMYGNLHSSYMDAREQDMFHELSNVKPLVILVAADSWPFKEHLLYNAVDNRQPWKPFFADNYRLTKQTDDYRIYARVK